MSEFARTYSSSRSSSCRIRCLVGSLYESGDRDAFENAPIWSSPAYVGAGPYRLVEWDKSIRLTYRAFDGYFLGRPKIDEVIFQVVADVNTVPALVLGGAVDATVAFVLNQEAMLAVKEHWSRTGEGQTVSYPVWFRAPQFQLHPARTQQPAILDLRVRRAIAHAVDRAALVEAILGDSSLVADIMLSPSDPLFPRAQRVITRYPFDRARALGLLEEVGWGRRGDQLVDFNGQRFTLDITGSNRGVNIIELSIIAGDLRSLGMQVSESPIPRR